jgi:hypothetical protein
MKTSKNNNNNRSSKKKEYIRSANTNYNLIMTGDGNQLTTAHRKINEKIEFFYFFHFISYKKNARVLIIMDRVTELKIC